MESSAVNCSPLFNLPLSPKLFFASSGLVCKSPKKIKAF